MFNFNFLFLTLVLLSFDFVSITIDKINRGRIRIGAQGAASTVTGPTGPTGPQGNASIEMDQGQAFETLQNETSVETNSTENDRFIQII